MKIINVLILILAALPLQAADDYRQQTGTGTWRTLPANDLAQWRSAGWTIAAEALPEGWAPFGATGNLSLIADGAKNRAVHFSGQLALPGMRLPGRGWLVVTMEARCGAVSLAGPVYGGPQGGQLGWVVLPEMESGTEWQSLTEVCRTDFPADSGAQLRVSSTLGVDWRGAIVRWYASPLDAYRNAFEQFQKPMPNLVKNGGFEQTEKMLSEDVVRWRGKGWNIGDGEIIAMASGFGPNGAWKDKTLRLIQDRAAAHGGENCLLTDLATGGGFTARADRQYLVSLWARGEGALSIFCHSYGGEKGGFLGNITVVPGEAWPLGQEWRNYQIAVPLKIAGNEQVGVLPVLSVSGKAWLDDFAVYELDTATTLQASIGQCRARLNETLTDQVRVGPRQRALLTDLLAAAAQLEAQVKTGQVTAAAVNRVAALEYVTPRVKSVIEFGDVNE